MSSHQIDLHGIVVRFTAPPDLLTGIRARLEHLPAAPQSEAELEIEYDLSRSLHERPADGRTVYESAEAEVVYSPAEDTLCAFHRRGATMRCAPAESRAEITGSLEQTWVLTRPLPTIALMELVRRRGLYPLHAACLARGNAGVLVSGPSGSGKSTLALALLEAGLDFLGDDLVFLRRDGETVSALGFPDELGLVQDARSVVPTLADGVDLTPPEGWPKARADLRQVAPAASIVSACAPALFVLLSARATPGRVEQIGADEALLELLPSILLTDPATCSEHLEALGAAARTATVLRMGPRPDLARTVSAVIAALG